MRRSVLFLFLYAFLLAASSLSGGQHARESRVSGSEIKALVQAIQDEIYDYGYEEYFFPEGGPVGDVVSSVRVRLPLYIDSVGKKGEARAVYKLMPHGEVLRYFYVQDDGTVRLEGNPQLGFPASQPSRKTVYLSDGDLDRMKHDWTKSSFEIDLSPNSGRVQDAVRRQKQRNNGFSAWEFARSKGGKPKQ